ncbi:MAG: hypothetical protein ACXWI1_01175 [Croceibacterium sp.]
MIKSSAALRFAALPLAACASLYGEPGGGPEQHLKLGQAGHFGPVDLTPVSVDQDSRCPVGTQCIWAGTVALKVLVEPAGANHAVFATLGQPTGVDGGTLLLEAVTPQRTSTGQIPPSHYRFTIRYTAPTR